METPPSAALAYHEEQTMLEVSRQFGFRVMRLHGDGLAEASQLPAQRTTALRGRSLPVAFPAKANKFRVPIQILK